MDRDNAHPSDPIGARNVDAEAQNRLRTEGEQHKAAPQIEGRPVRTSAENTVVQDMLETVRSFVLPPIPRPTPSTFVPNSRMMFTTLEVMDEAMAMNRYFAPKYLRWNPILTRIFYGTLFYIQTLRVQKYHTLLSSTQRRVLRDFEESFDYQDIPIAGPLVPFFKALSSSPPNKGNYGDIVPVIPDNLGANDAVNHALEENIRTLLPNLVGLRRAANAVQRRIGANVPVEWRGFMHNSAAAAGIVPAHNAANVQSRDARVMPGSATAGPWNQRTWNDWQNHPSPIAIPDIPLVAGNLDIGQYLGFDVDYKWFSHLNGIMSIHAKFWKGSSTMKALSLHDGNHNQIVCMSQAIFPDRNAHRDVDVSFDHHAIAVSNGQTFDDLAPKLAVFTQINFMPPVNFAPIADHAGVIGQTRFGDFWTQTPIESQSTTVSPALALPRIISDLHLDRPDKI